MKINLNGSFNYLDPETGIQSGPKYAIKDYNDFAFISMIKPLKWKK